MPMSVFYVSSENASCLKSSEDSKRDGKIYFVVDGEEFHKSERRRIGDYGDATDYYREAYECPRTDLVIQAIEDSNLKGAPADDVFYVSKEWGEELKRVGAKEIYYCDRHSTGCCVQ